MSDYDEHRSYRDDHLAPDSAVEARYARLSVPTQLRLAGHRVTANPVGITGALVYCVDGEAMTLVEAADRFLPGGWAESFGRSGS